MIHAKEARGTKLPFVPADAGTQFLGLDSRFRGNERCVDQPFAAFAFSRRPVMVSAGDSASGSILRWMIAGWPDATAAL